MQIGVISRRYVVELWIALPVLLLILVAVIADFNDLGEAGPNLPRLRALYQGDPTHWPKPHIDRGVAYVEISMPELPSRAMVRRPVVQLGQKLFNDPALSASGHFACQSCHNRRLGWGDGLPRSFGHARQQGTRNAPALFAAGVQKALFWDGRATTLEGQALVPLMAAHEMANTDLDGAVARIAADQSYHDLMTTAFGSKQVTVTRIAMALAEFQRSLDRRTRFDRFLRGSKRALSDEAIWGLHLFRTKARCANCHMGPHLTDHKFHNLGLSYYNRKLEDVGRYNVTGIRSDVGKFRTPSLRHLARTGPYMHNGVFPSLRGLVNLYNIGGGRSARDLKNGDPLYPHAANKSVHMRPLGLSRAEKAALVAFLESL